MKSLRDQLTEEAARVQIVRATQQQIIRSNAPAPEISTDPPRISLRDQLRQEAQRVQKLLKDKQATPAQEILIKEKKTPKKKRQRVSEKL